MRLLLGSRPHLEQLVEASGRLGRIAAGGRDDQRAVHGGHAVPCAAGAGQLQEPGQGIHDQERPPNQYRVAERRAGAAVSTPSSGRRPEISSGTLAASVRRLRRPDVAAAVACASPGPGWTSPQYLQVNQSPERDSLVWSRPQDRQSCRTRTCVRLATLYIVSPGLAAPRSNRVD